MPVAFPREGYTLLSQSRAGKQRLLRLLLPVRVIYFSRDILFELTSHQISLPRKKRLLVSHYYKACGEKLGTESR